MSFTRKKYNVLNNALGWLCFVIAAVTYLLTIEPTASFWDCPEFIAQGAKLEVGHPPGNPIFMLTARFFVTLFGGIANAAVAVNTMSALLSAATILLLFWTITHLTYRLLQPCGANGDQWNMWRVAVTMGAGLCGALAFTWSDTFWFSAVEGEVYAFSSLCTALVFWLILKWENRADQPHSDRYLILIAYVIGVSIAVHLLNLLCIPAIALVIYYRKYNNVTAKGSLLTLLISVVVLGLILYGLVPGFMKVAQWFEILFVNTFGCGYNTGVLFYGALVVAAFVWAVYALYTQRSPMQIKLSFAVAIFLSGILFIGSSTLLAVVLVVGLLAYLFFFCRKVPVRIFNIIILSIFVIFVGYSSYALLLIRASANTPMNQNQPDNVFALASYMSREQYGERPLFNGPTFVEELVLLPAEGHIFAMIDTSGKLVTRPTDAYQRDETGQVESVVSQTYTMVAKTSPDQPDQYVKEVSKADYKTRPELNMLLTRMYSSDPSHIQGYKDWSGYSLSSKVPSEVKQQWMQGDVYANPYNQEQGVYFVDYDFIKPYLESNAATYDVTDEEGYQHQQTVYTPSVLDNLKYFANYQLNQMYWRYFMWNFAGRQNDIAGDGQPNYGNWISGIPLLDNMRLGDQKLLPDEYGKGNKAHNVFYMLPLLMGIFGLLWQALARPAGSDPKRGIEQFWVIFFLFFMTGIAIVLNLNQTPGQPRERDYAFAGSFYAYAIWLGMGVPAIALVLEDLLRKQKSRAAVSSCIAIAIGLFVPLQMVSQTWDDHDRSGRYTTRDFGMNYLDSLDPNAVIFTNGDNDTFPLWYAQEVEGHRTDVRVINLMYLTTDWYANQQKLPSYGADGVPMLATNQDYAYDKLAYNGVWPYNKEPMPALEALAEYYDPVKSSVAEYYNARFLKHPVMTLPSDSATAMKRWLANTADSLRVLPVTPMVDLSGSRGVNLSTALSLDIIANNFKNGFNRPTYFAITVPGQYYMGLQPYMRTTGMAYEVTPFGEDATPVNLDRAYINIMTKFRWGGLDQPDAQNLYLDETVRRMVSSTRVGIMEAVDGMMAMGNAPAPANIREMSKDPNMTYYDMARNLLNKMQTSMPYEVQIYDSSMGYQIANAYIALYENSGNAADLASAKELLAKEAIRFAQGAKYIVNVTGPQSGYLDSTTRAAGYLLMEVVAAQNHVAMLEQLAKRGQLDEPTIAELNNWFDSTNIIKLLYVDGYTHPDLVRLRDESTAKGDDYFASIVQDCINLQDMSSQLGINTMAITNQVCQRTGLTVTEFQRALAMFI